MNTHDLLIEIGCEELPAKSLTAMAQAFAAGMTVALDKIGIAHGEVWTGYTPRRLALIVSTVADAQPEQHTERRGPAQNAAYGADGTPSKALIGFAHSVGVGIDQLELLSNDKGAWYVHRQSRPGAATIALLAELLDGVLKALPIAKPMRWGSRTDAFLRPIHTVSVLLGDQVVSGEIFGVSIGRQSAGHRFHHPQPVWISSAADYVDALRAAHVLVDPAERRARVLAEVLLATPATLNARLDDDLVDEVVNLVEWPRAIACSFDPAFLAVPQEALVTTMQQNQRFFPLLDAHGELSAQFIGIANIDSSDPNEIRKGYERVIRPRFADAKFFFDEDLKTPLLEHKALLKATVFQAKLGSIWEKAERIGVLARYCADAFGVEGKVAARAAALSKCDLMTRMVGEFPELQGAMGKRLALRQGESVEIANALDEIYQPRFAADAIAPSALGQLLAVCERADTLAGIFAVGMKPSGNKDPFALRRAALGLARTLIDAGVEVDLLALIQQAADGCTHAGTADAREIYGFVIERLRSHYADVGVETRVFDAVAALRPRVLADFDSRIQAARTFAALPEASALAAANKRIGNILKKLAAPVTAEVDPALFEVPAEHALFEAWQSIQGDIESFAQQRNYTALLQRLAKLHAPIDAFFDGVMVMSEDPRQRDNRLALLSTLRMAFLRVADISLL